MHKALELLQKNNTEAFSLLAESTRHQIAALKDEVNKGINQMNRDIIEYLKKWKVKQNGSSSWNLKVNSLNNH